MATTMLSNLINPEVMADMINAKIPNKIVVTPFAHIDTTLQGAPGNTITVPRYEYIGDAEDIAEGVAMGTVALSTGTTQATVKKAGKAVEITDEAKLSGYGNPIDEAAAQLAKAVASKMDNDALECITDANAVQLTYDGSASVIKYSGIVDAVDVFNEEVNSEKVIFVNPKQVTALRKDADFLSADKYGTGTSVMVKGEIGTICNCHVVPTRKVVLNEGTYACPIVKLQTEGETEDESPAITIYMKRSVAVEPDRDVLAKKDIITVDQHYTAALTNTSKVVLATFKA